MEKERPPTERPKPAGDGGEPAGAGLGAIRNDMDKLLSVGDSLVEKALSTDSAEFLKASEQQGGQ